MYIDYNDLADGLYCTEWSQHAFIKNEVVGNFKTKDDAKNLSLEQPVYWLHHEENLENDHGFATNVLQYNFSEINYLFRQLTGFITENELLENNYYFKDCRIVNIGYKKENILDNPQVYDFVDLLEGLGNIKISFGQEYHESEDRIRDNYICYLKTLEIIENFCIRFLNWEIYKIKNDILKFANIETMGLDNCIFKDTQLYNLMPLDICEKISHFEFKNIKITKSDMIFLAVPKNLYSLKVSFCNLDDDAFDNF
ncbi:hypothetical protein CWI38_0539p0010 [Hamiltosporidium tvaerminnensis]|uniref:Uncharacterized protein n=1 Tax=Hamiltosporidium tvaerminnensis TaxID=1176355 RepID=A0A4V2JXT7_9MICR|nr:hypothetical protein CWI38_0539p0010 [Hamiltosporidium tvaerminnensis]